MADQDTGSVAIVRRKAATAPRHLRQVLSLHDFEPLARRRLPRSVFGYVSGGVEAEVTLRANRAAFDRIALQPRILRDVSVRSQRLALFGQDHAVPFAVAPMGFSSLAAYDGDVALARAARQAGSFAICSAATLTPLERVATEGGSGWFQCYIPGDRARIEGLLARVAQAGFHTLVVTGDVPVAANRENNARNGFDAPFRITPQLIWQGLTHPRWTIGTLGREVTARGMPHFENMEAVQGPPLFSRDLVRSTIARDRLNWDDLRFIRDRWQGRLLVKGVLHPADAQTAAEAGCDGIIVSNHGGRQANGGIATIDLLADVVAAAGDVPVLFDSGVRSGTDAVKALAMGARAVGVGRPYTYGLALGGAEGAAWVLRSILAEADLLMAVNGYPTLADVRAAGVQRTTS